MTQPPHNLLAENAVIGAIILRESVLPGVMQIVQPRNFYFEVNRKLYAYLVTMRCNGQKIDSTTLVERLTEIGELEAIGGTAYLADVMQSVVVAAHAEYYAAIVRDYAVDRAVQRELGRE